MTDIRLRTFVVDSAKNASKERTILDLSYRPRISHGPRKRSAEGAAANDNGGNGNGGIIGHFQDKIEDFLDIPLYCWKVLINCHRFRNHVCCPVMPDYMRPKKKKKRSKKKKAAAPRYVFSSLFKLGQFV